MTTRPPLTPPVQTCQVFPAAAIYVGQGVNTGEGLGLPEEVCPGDIYSLDPQARPLHLALCHGGEGQRVAEGSHVGLAGAEVRLLARYRMMGEGGDGVDLLLIDAGGADLFALPLSPMAGGAGYTLLRVEEDPGAVQLADLVCMSFARGTMITLGDGRQRAIEALAPGDLVLTRDHGRQPVRWVGRATLRGVGSFAPVVITKGTLGNAGDLIVSPHHRIFLYQRQRAAGMQTSEVLVQAKHLVNDETVFRHEGGFVDYLSLVFDAHEIIYAEGIPVESLMVNEATVTRLPAAFAEGLRQQFPGLSQSQHFGTEAGAQAVEALVPGLKGGPGRR